MPDSCVRPSANYFRSPRSRIDWPPLIPPQTGGGEVCKNRAQEGARYRHTGPPFSRRVTARASRTLVRLFRPDNRPELFVATGTERHARVQGCLLGLTVAGHRNPYTRARAVRIGEDVADRDRTSLEGLHR